MHSTQPAILITMSGKVEQNHLYGSAGYLAIVGTDMTNSVAAMFRGNHGYSRYLGSLQRRAAAICSYTTDT